MEIILTGMSHKTAPVEIREKFSLPKETLGEFLKQLAELPGVQEGMILSTCNRVEILAVVEEEKNGAGKLMDLLAGIAGLESKELAPYLSMRENEEAVKHLFRVTASLDSLVIGEPQILGQVKEAYRQAVANKVSGIILNKLLHRSFFVAKRIRSETKIATQAVSVSFAAVELAKKILGPLNDKGVMLIGAGEMAELAARHLLSQGVKEILIANRTPSRAAELAQEMGGQAIPFADIPGKLKEADIVLSSTGSANYIIRKEQLAGVMRARKNRPIFFIDIAVPRDVDPAINEIENIYVYDIDDLQGVVETNKEERKKEIQRAEEIVQQGVENFRRWLSSLEVVPTILSLRHRLDKIRQGELEKTFSFLKNATAEERRVLNLMTQAIINKILHHPISLLKHQEKREQGKLYVDMIRKIFHLDEEDEEEFTA